MRHKRAYSLRRRPSSSARGDQPTVATDRDVAADDLQGCGRAARDGRSAVAEAGRIRRLGGGRKRVEEGAPRITRELTRIVEETTAGDPMSLLKWTSKSTRAIAEELTRRGYPVSAVTVGRCLPRMGYSLQANVKTIEGAQHPDRDAQFRYINGE